MKALKGNLSKQTRRAMSIRTVESIDKDHQEHKAVTAAKTLCTVLSTKQLVVLNKEIVCIELKHPHVELCFG